MLASGQKLDPQSGQASDSETGWKLEEKLELQSGQTMD